MLDEKKTLKHYLQRQRDALVWKLDGASERDIRWPMTPTGTNLLGIVKHVASVEIGYFGDIFGRPSGEPLPWLSEAAPDNADMWATPGESRQSIIDLHHRSWAHSDRTIDGKAGHRADSSNIPDHDAAWWAEYVAQLQQAAEDSAPS